jgi:hypothetical protein
MKLYEEGVEALEVEALRRGSQDAYPVSTLITFLSRVVQANPSNSDAESKVKRHVSYAMQHFRDDKYAMNVVSDYFRHFGG